MFSRASNIQISGGYFTSVPEPLLVNRRAMEVHSSTLSSPPPGEVVVVHQCGVSTIAGSSLCDIDTCRYAPGKFGLETVTRIACSDLSMLRSTQPYELPIPTLSTNTQTAGKFRLNVYQCFGVPR
jgi:hypothetical protein